MSDYVEPYKTTVIKQNVNHCTWHTAIFIKLTYN